MFTGKEFISVSNKSKSVSDKTVSSKTISDRRIQKKSNIHCLEPNNFDIHNVLKFKWHF